ncbi:glycosyltransferase family 2 protein [Alloscardovia criceti]|uniref:glycosyltransferase family 2 protein n=1 Tax=Alloscardovia criceti TaxID=356828 RepID=UPI0003766639|nr:glycosyltransferase family 2 protein [Alloscardovia criceti]
MTDGFARDIPTLAIVVPCYNEEEVIDHTSHVLKTKISHLIHEQLIRDDSYILFVDDGSRDKTWEKIEQLHSTDVQTFHGLKFAHNRGHQNAVYAGLMDSLDQRCDVAVSMDADLQDDPNAIDDMVREYLHGAEIVYGVRDNRETDTAFKRTTAEAFYNVMSWLGTDTIPNHADFRLMSAKAIQGLSEYRESNLFLRGIVPDLGFKSAQVFYKRGIREAGESKYPLSKMISFAFEGITSFSVKPMKFIIGMGVTSVFVGLAALLYTVTSVFSGHAVAGWGSMMVSLWILGGCILLSLGIVGEYIGKIYLEVKDRPRYIVEERI